MGGRSDAAWAPTGDGPRRGVVTDPDPGQRDAITWAWRPLRALPDRPQPHPRPRALPRLPHQPSGQQIQINLPLHEPRRRRLGRGQGLGTERVAIDQPVALHWGQGLRE